MTRFVISIILLLVSNPGIAKDLYIWVDESGVKHYSQTPPDKDVGQPVEKRNIKTPKDNLDPADYDYKGTVDQWGRTNTKLNSADIIKIERQCKKATTTKEAYENCIFYSKEDYKVSKSRLEKQGMTTSEMNSSCIPEPRPGWEAASLQSINDYYELRVDQCKQSFRSGSFQLKNCTEEQENIRKNKIANLHEKKSRLCKP